MKIKVTNREAVQKIKDKQEFSNNASTFIGRLGGYSIGEPDRRFGPYKQAFRLAADMHRENLYVVYSYSTPIAWCAKRDDYWTVPQVRYSATTDRHLSLVRRAIGIQGLVK